MNDSESGFMSRLGGSRLFSVVRVAATLAIVGGLIYKLSLDEIVDTIREADPWLLLAAFGLLCVVQALVVVKWLRLLAAREVDAPLLQVIRAYCVGNLLSNVLPTAVGGDVYRIYRIQREANARAADVTMTVLYERATGYVAMTFLGALGAAFYYGNAAIGFLALAGGAATALVLMWLLPRVPFPSIREGHFLRNLIANRRELIAVYQMAVFSLLIQAMYISTIALTGRAMGAHISWWFWAFATWVVAVTVLLPITLGGLGVRESSFSALVHRAGGTAAQGASTGFALGILLIAANTLGLIAVEIAERLGFAREHADTPTPQDVREPVGDRV
jgi:hypothetical protein